MNVTFKAAVAALILAVAVARLVAAGPLEDASDAAERRDYATAIRLWRSLADQGEVDAQYNLGVMYDKGQGVTRDYAVAVGWFRKAADQGFAPAQLSLGVMYENGWGVTRNHVIAHMWFSLAAVRGDRDAARNQDIAAAKLTPAQIAEAQRLFREWDPNSAPR